MTRAARPAAPVAPATGRIRLGERLVEYALERRPRRSIGFVIGPQGLRVQAPVWLGRAALDAALVAKSNWILAKLAEQQARVRHHAATRIAWHDGSVVPFLGEPLRIALDPTLRVAALVPADTSGPARLRLPLPADASAAVVEPAARRWLDAEARRLFAERCAHFGPRLGVAPRAVRLTSARTRWGSASADGTVRLNRRLVHLSPASIDYVVVHELAHLREMNHGSRFWAVVASVLPDHAALRHRLRAEAVDLSD